MDPETNEQKNESSVVQESNFFSTGYSTIWPDLVKKPAEHHKQECSKGSMGYKPPLSKLPVTQPCESNVHYVSHTECHRTEECSILNSEKSTKTSECSLYVGDTREKLMDHHEVQRSNLLALEEPPDLASVKRSEIRSPKSVSRRLLVVSEFPFEQRQLFNLFNLIPGLESCEISRSLYSDHVYAVVQYNNAASTIYAKHKLHGFEYPFGSWLLVTFIEEGTVQTNFIRPKRKRMPFMICDNSSSFQLGTSESQSSSSYLQTAAELPSCKRKAPSDSSV